MTPTASRKRTTGIRATGDTTLPASRRLELLEAGRPVAYIQTHLTAPPFASLQILHIEVVPERRRSGLGSQLLTAAIADAATLLGKTKLRRVHTATAHKSHLHFRAFLTRHGFHHTATTTGLLKDEDLLVYIKSYT
jgi:GNAT superfamily N-acetyltransferase